MDIGHRQKFARLLTDAAQIGQPEGGSPEERRHREVVAYLGAILGGINDLLKAQREASRLLQREHRVLGDGWTRRPGRTGA